MTNKAKKIVVLGAGCAGLGAAWRLAEAGADVELIEVEPRVGGLGASVGLNGNLYEYGPHMFHTDDPGLLDRIQKLVGDEIITRERFFQIKFQGKSFRYPLKMKDIVLGLDKASLILCAASFAVQMAKNKLFPRPYKSSEDVLISTYGRRLYNIFFKDYSTKFWGLPPSAMSDKFALQRIPRNDALAILKKWARLGRRRGKNNLDDFVELVLGKLYYTPRGNGRILEKIAEVVGAKGGRVHLSSRINNIITQNNRAAGVTFTKAGTTQRIDCDFIISTIPIRSLIGYLAPAPDKVTVRIAEGLKYRSLVIVGILVKRRKVFPSLFVYFRDKTFNRLADLGNIGLRIQPEGSTILLAEVSCGYNDEVWNSDEALKRRVIRELCEENLIKEDEVIETHILKSQYAYPIYDLDYEKKLGHLQNWLGSFDNMASIGRQGSFGYMNMHVALRKGFDTAGWIIANTKRT